MLAPFHARAASVRFDDTVTLTFQAYDAERLPVHALARVPSILAHGALRSAVAKTDRLPGDDGEIVMAARLLDFFDDITAPQGGLTVLSPAGGCLALDGSHYRLLCDLWSGYRATLPLGMARSVVAADAVLARAEVLSPPASPDLTT